jgi:hypothetical protein
MKTQGIWLWIAPQQHVQRSKVPVRSKWFPCLHWDEEDPSSTRFTWLRTLGLSCFWLREKKSDRISCPVVIRASGPHSRHFEDRARWTMNWFFLEGMKRLQGCTGMTGEYVEWTRSDQDTVINSIRCRGLCSICGGTPDICFRLIDSDCWSISLGHLSFENASSDGIRRDSDISGSLMSVHSIPPAIYPNLSIEFFSPSNT